METNQNNQKKLLMLFIVLTGILAITCGALTYKLMQTQEFAESETLAKNEAKDENAKLVVQLQDLEKQYDQLSQEYNNLDSLFTAEKEKVKKMIKEIKGLKGNAATYKEKVAMLENRLKDYLSQIEELKAKNQSLTMENITVKANLDSALTVNTKLTASNEDLTNKVTTGSALKAYEVYVDAIKMRSNKEIPVEKAKKADKIRACFVISENPLTSKGAKKVYVRISQPDGVVLSKGKDDAYSFMYEGKSIQYSMKKDINYDGKAMDMCLYWEKTNDFKAGRYGVDIFVDDQLIGTTNLMLE